MRQTAFVYCFTVFELDPVRRWLTVGGEFVHLTESQFSVLLHLVSHAPEIVGHDALAQAGWGGTTSDNSVQQAISRLRKVLVERGGCAFIDTVPNRGYRFTASVGQREPTDWAGIRDIDGEAAEAFVRGKRELATLTKDGIANASREFETVIALKPKHAYAHTNLAQALALTFEGTRVDEICDTAALERAVHHARVGAALEPSAADAHSTLAFALSISGDTQEATVAAWKAVSIDNASWRHWLRLAFVTWGEERCDHAEKALTRLSNLAQASWLKSTVYVARGAFEPALTHLQAGCGAQDRQRDNPRDYPAVGLHLLRGLVLAAQERLPEAEDEFTAELAGPNREQIYWRECAANTWYARGAIRARQGQIRDANAAFERALQVAPAHLFSLAALGRPLPTVAPDDPRALNAGIARAIALTRGNRHREAAEAYREAIATSRAAHAGWILPVEPILHASARPEVWNDMLAVIRERAV